ncbi:hypothetical protein [Lysobacter gummosus]|uniref:Uncharacterized protein n=1 Tax=Lysobacter gummosus TaxID=262324 RepID=A0ABY3XES5_9GAMM|nr:hypothetical protein [Lysobacter gummosus]ALN89479.1 hypothetical protein LG3211_0494 [Lysobacter gummosus]UNP30126.1 hypothetical protein MOV92_02275 [Lysobacter gummosus]
MDVKEATRTIQGKLDDSGFLDDVTHAELRDINGVFRELSSQDARQVYDGLKAHGKLDKWVEEMNSGGWFGTGGLSAGEKTDLFNMLAGKLTGAQLADFSGHLSSEDVIALGKAVASHADANTAVDYVKAMAPQTTGQSAPRNDSSAGHASLGVENPAARAVGEVLASMPPAAFGAAIDGLRSDQLAAVMKTAAGMTISSPAIDFNSRGAPSGVAIDYDPRLLTRILDNAAKSGDASAQAKTFQAASGQLKTMREDVSFPSTYVDQGNDLRAVADAMTGLLKKNPSGIMSELESKLDRNGNSLIPYTSEMVAQDRGLDLREIIEGLKTGPVAGTNSADYIAEPVADSRKALYYPHAQTLGYFVGAIEVGMSKEASNAKAEGDLLKNVFATTAGALGAVNPAAGAFGAAANGVYVVADDALAADIASGRKDARDELRDRAYPREKNNAPYEGAAEKEYDTAASRVVNAHRD